MFIPHEAIYYDQRINKIGNLGEEAESIIQRAAGKYHVIVVSPTSFLAYLQTVLQGLRALKIEEQAKEIQQRVGDLSRHISAHEDSMHRLGSSLGTTVNHFNKAHKELKNVDKDVVKIAGETAEVEPLLLERPTEDID